MDRWIVGLVDAMLEPQSSRGATAHSSSATASTQWDNARYILVCHCQIAVTLGVNSRSLRVRAPLPPLPGQGVVSWDAR